uniref:Na/Pi cotransporter family protein n=1 Tax=candidate division WOR-3 bacterium TaxID=2052148 RepID=A0A7V3NVE1_UNCW3
MYGLILAVSFYFFFLSIELLSKGFQLLGSGFANMLIQNTAHPLVGFSTGLLATAIVQSSSSTTSIIVSLIAAGTLNIRNAIPMIMGANIGTTVTNTLVSLAHLKKGKEFEKALQAATVHDFFNLLTAFTFLPLEYFFHPLEKSATFLAELFKNIGGFKAISPLKIILEPFIKLLLNTPIKKYPSLVIVVAIVMLLLSLKYIVESMTKISKKYVDRYLNTIFFKNTRTSFISGLVLTSIVQSSSCTTSLIVPLAAVDLLDLRRIFYYTMGANIGTTITAILAALITKSPSALAIAFTHLLFNVYGVILNTLIYRELPVKIAKFFAKIATKRKVLALLYIIVVFYFVPALIIWIGGRK